VLGETFRPTNVVRYVRIVAIATQTTPLGRGFIAFLSAMAEDERERITKRAHEGRAAARGRGVHMGRTPKLDAYQRAEALKRLAAGESCRAVARSYRVRHATISRLADE
jgi:DNA invertase Pin-like site-specific DNA recombinase